MLMKGWMPGRSNRDYARHVLRGLTEGDGFATFESIGARSRDDMERVAQALGSHGLRWALLRGWQDNRTVLVVEDESRLLSDQERRARELGITSMAGPWSFRWSEAAESAEKALKSRINGDGDHAERKMHH
jgi:hypothetical protein